MFVTNSGWGPFPTTTSRNPRRYRYDQTQTRLKSCLSADAILRFFAYRRTTGRNSSTRNCSSTLSRESPAERTTLRQKSTKFSSTLWSHRDFLGTIGIGGGSYRRWIAHTNFGLLILCIHRGLARVLAVDDLLTARRLHNKKWNAEELRAYAAAYHRCFVAGDFSPNVCPGNMMAADYILRLLQVKSPVPSPS